MDTETLVVGAVLLVALVGIALLWRKQTGSRSNERSRSQRQKQPASTTKSNGRSKQATAPSQDQQQLNWLVGKAGAVKGKAFHVGERMASVGRGVANYIQVADDTASDRHALLTGTGTSIHISDMNSSNGTTVNGRTLGSDEEYILEDGDEIEIGDTVFVYRRRGNYENHAHSQTKQANTADKTQAVSVDSLVGSSGDLQQQVMIAIKAADGNYEQAADAVGLDVEILEQIVQKAQRNQR